MNHNRRVSFERKYFMYNNMGITFEKLLTMDLFKDAKILAGSRGLGNRITKVNVMEVPDIIEWVGEGEFLLTTAYSIKDNVNILKELVPKFQQKGVSGLGIKVGRYVNEIPEDVIELADGMSFPIIEVPFYISHTEVISSILTEVMNDQMNMLIKIENFNKEIMNIMIKGGKLKEIVRKLYENIGNPIAVYENIYNTSEIICDDNIKEDIENIIDNYINSNYSDNKDNIAYKHEAGHEDIIGGNTSERLVFPVVIENVDYGSVFIWLTEKPLSQLDKMLVESYVHVIALDFMKKLSLYNVESSYRLEFFEDLLSDNEKRQLEAFERSKNFGFRRDLAYCAAIIRFKELNKSTDNKKENLNLSHEMLRFLVFILNRFQKASEDKFIYVDKSDRVIVLLGVDPKNDTKSIKNYVNSFFQKVSNELQERYERKEFVIGIGKSCLNYTELYKSYSQAKLIVDNLHHRYMRNVIDYDDLGIYKILSYEGIQGELEEFCNDTIKPLMDYDRDNNSELIKTLKVYFECDGNMKKISERMFMHYNTIIYRLQKIRDITGVNIENSDSRLNLQIALKAIEIIK